MADKIKLDIIANDKTRAGFQSAERGIAGLQSKFSGLGAAIGSLGLLVMAREQASVIAEFERLAASLKIVTGSAENAKGAMAFLRDFAANTPYQLQEVVGGFIKLSALGLEPSREALESYGNTASAMGKSLNQMIEAVADAATGEFERLKEFGIKSKSEKDKVSFTFQGVTTTVGKNAREIEGYLKSIGQVQFAGAMAEQMDTLGGKLSNLQDAWDGLIVQWSHAGAGTAFGGIVDGMIWSVKKLESAVNETPKVFISLFAGIEKGWEHVSYVFSYAGESIKSSFGETVSELKEIYGRFLDLVATGLDQLPFASQQAEYLHELAASFVPEADNSMKEWEQRLDTLRKNHQQRLAQIDATAMESWSAVDQANAAAANWQPPEKKGGAQDTGQDDAELTKLREKLEKKIEALRVSKLSELDALREGYLAEQDLLQEALENEVVTTEYYQDLKRQSYDAYETDLTAILNREAQKRADAANKESQDRVDSFASMAGSITSMTASLAQFQGNNSKTMFRINKAAGIAQATIDTYAAATKAMNGTYTSWYTQLAAYAAVLAKGLGAVSAISSTSFEGGGGVAAGGYGGGTVNSPIVTTPTDQERPPQSITLVVEGNIIGEDQWVEDRLIPALREMNTRNIELTVAS